jgi:isoquinoline 1-oxidoreductase beta subunit
MSEIINLSRRSFLKTTALAGGGLVLGVYLPAPDGSDEAAQQKTTTFAPNAFVRIATDDSVTVIVNHSEMGQGPYTSIPMIVAEELEADWSKLHVEPAPVDPIYNHTIYGMQVTGGSTSTSSEWERLRKAGAAAKIMLISAAANTWQVDPSTCRVENGHVLHPASGRRLSFGQLAESASRLDPPQHITLKDPKDFRLIGKPTRRLDTPDKITGKAVFGLDINLPGMLVALVARPPVFGAKLKSFDATRAKAVPGVRHVVEIDRGIAVVADGYWPAHKGRQALTISWDEGPGAGFNSTTQREHYAHLAQQPGIVARNQGDAAAALDRAAKTLEAVYTLPYLAHATMEPLNCVADVRPDHCEVWVGTQFQTVDRDAAAQESGLQPDQVTLHTTLMGGGFGRRGVFGADMVREAVQISRGVQAPVKVIWSREDDMRGGYYRPAAHHALTAGLNAAGAPVAWRQRIVCQSIMAGTPFESALFKDGVEALAVEGAANLPYDIPNLFVDWQRAPADVPVWILRSVGSSHTAFAVESFLDELAHAAGTDPLEFRLALLGSHPRHRRVLELAAARSGWGTPPPQGQGRGIAVHESFGSFVAQVAEVSVSSDGKLRVHHVVCAIDCGPVVNPDTVRAQMEGGIAFGLSAALHGEISFDKGRVKQRNFHDYPVLRMNEMPAVETHIVPSTEKMGGVGEPGVPPIAPAVANAIFSLTGRRVRCLPIRPEVLKMS